MEIKPTEISREIREIRWNRYSRDRVATSILVIIGRPRTVGRVSLAILWSSSRSRRREDLISEEVLSACVRETGCLEVISLQEKLRISMLPFLGAHTRFFRYICICTNECATSFSRILFHAWTCLLLVSGLSPLSQTGFCRDLSNVTLPDKRSAISIQHR